MIPNLHSVPAVLLLVWGGMTSTARAHEAIDTALADIDKQLLTHADDPQLHLRRAALLLEHGEPGPALKAADRARILGGELHAVTLLEAEALLDLHFPRKAIASLDPLLVLHPDFRPARVLRARALGDSGDKDSAVGEYRVLLSVDADPDIAFQAAGILVETGDPAGAVRLLDDGFPQQSRPPSIELRALEIEVAMKSWDAALDRVDRRIAQSARPEPWMARRAETLATAGRAGPAIAAWNLLADHLRTLPAEIRTSHAMQLLAEQSRAALASPGPEADPGHAR